MRVSDRSESSEPSQPVDSGGISPMRWLAGQVGLLDLLGEPESTPAARVPISAHGRYDPATAAKIADNEAFNRPLSTYEWVVRDFLRAQRINPATWQMAEPLPEDAQKTFRDNGYQIWAAIEPFAFVGPDGVLYRKNEYTREDPGSARIRVFNWLQEQAKAADEPPPDPIDVFWKAVAAGQFIPGAQYRGPVPPTVLGQMPPRVPAPPVSPAPAASAAAGKRVPNPWGSPGKPETQIQNLAIEAYIKRTNPTWEHVAGGSKRAKAIPGLFGSNTGSYFGDLVFRTPDGKLVTIETTSVNRLGKETNAEWEKSLWGFLRGAGDVYNIPKTWQLKPRDTDGSD
jgi:hypothetical protein